MRATRAGPPTVVLLRLLVAAALLLPVMVFAAVGWVSHGETWRDAETSLRRETGLMAEHFLRLFDAHQLIATHVSDQVLQTLEEPGPFPEKRFHDHMTVLAQGLPQIYSIWAYRPDGDLLASSAVYPAPADVNFSDRAYFQAVKGGADLFISDVTRGRLAEHLFFTVVRPIRDAAGAFRGAVAVSADPSYFSTVFRRMVEGDPSVASLIHESGAFLATEPVTLPGAGENPYGRLPADAGLFQAIKAAPESGTYVFTSLATGDERLYAYHKLGDLPLYVLLARNSADVAAAWRGMMVRYLPFAVAATVLLGSLAWVAARRASAEAKALARLRSEQNRTAVAETALRRAQRMEAMGQLTGGIAHDFNNLMQVVASSISLLRRSPPEALRDQALDALDTAIDRGRQLTGQLLSFARRQSVEPRALSLPEAVSHMESLLGRGLRGNIDLVIDLPGELWPVFVDPAEFDLALLNLALNARDAMPEGGRLSVTGHNVTLARGDDLPPGDYVSVTIADTGEGIPPHLLDSVLEPFFTTKAPGKGTGLGLSQVYGFARQAGGRVSVESGAGTGTAVTLLLPRCPEAVTANASGHNTAMPGALPGRGRPLDVLCVEDDAMIARSTAAVLAAAGHRVTAVPGAAEALERVEGGVAVDVVLSDILMPGDMDGLELARRIRGRRPDLPVVLITGYSGSAQAAAAEGLSVLRKPCSAGDLEAALQGAVAQPGARAAGLSNGPPP